MCYTQLWEPSRDLPAEISIILDPSTMSEDGAQTAEKMDTHTQYYLESLIIDALKGKGFQKIIELFDGKVIFSSQFHNKLLLSQLDKLINKELDRNEFKHVSVLMKCIQHFCKNDCQESSTLIHQGLVSKMVLWFERTVDFLRISKEATLLTLVEDFYDSALVICKCNCEDGKRQLLDSFLIRLGHLVTEKWVACHLRLEALRTINCILDSISREDKKKLHCSEDLCELTKDLARTIQEAGDYDIQVAISEALCRMMGKKFRDSFVHQWFEDNFLADAFKEIKDKEFETDCRKFLNCLNSRHQSNKGVYTFPCITVFTDLDELKKPQDENMENFWIDFNAGSQCVSFYIHNTEGSLWDSVRLLKESVNNYILKENDGQQMLGIYLKDPQVINTNDVTKVKIYFEPKHDIKSAIKRVFEDINEIHSNPVELDSTEGLIDIGNSLASHTVITTATTFKQWKRNQANKMDSASDILGSQTSEHSSTTKTSSANQSVQKSLSSADSHEIVIESVPLEAVITIADEQPNTAQFQDDMDDAIFQGAASDVPAKVQQDSSQEIIIITEASADKEFAAKKTQGIFQFQGYSDTLASDQVSDAKKKILLPKQSTERATPASRYRASVNSPLQRTSSAYRSHLFCESNEVTSNTESERSWIQDFKNKSAVKSADYSCAKTRNKSKRKVLPLASESGDDEKQVDTTETVSRFMSRKEMRRPEDGNPKSPHSAELKLPGISALLTPGDSRSQSDYRYQSAIDDQDIMDPVEEASSPEMSIDHNKEPKNGHDEVYASGPLNRSVDGNNIYHAADTLQHATGKRKHKTCEREEIPFKPRKLFSSTEKNVNRSAADSEDSEDVFYSESHDQDLAEASVLSAFDSFTKELKRKFLTRYKRIENRANHVLKSSHQQVSTVLNEIHQCRLQKINHFNKIVVHELSSLEAEVQALKQFEKETLDFWEDQYVKMNTFCSSQTQRIKTMDSAILETISNLKNVIQKTTKEEVSNTEEHIQNKLLK
ncbi:synaptonemal complex protein 2-like isoform X2 [Xenopus laevis]|uniref:Synaptonemal complex protein 2-like isoform X2 n=1 Tax=Xenopus laevis TaxID=8355 RepID=A0A8J1L377_XENLA|nr:synaptonemal complex protein 2-like isoform X2 [Xenopus laevis]